jgi:hypothetical protein
VIATIQIRTKAKSFYIHRYEESRRVSNDPVGEIESINLSYQGDFLRKYPIHKHRNIDPSHNYFIFRASIQDYGRVLFSDAVFTTKENGILVLKSGSPEREFIYKRVMPK